jgi:hypothetical protein
MLDLDQQCQEINDWMVKIYYHFLWDLKILPAWFWSKIRNIDMKGDSRCLTITDDDSLEDDSRLGIWPGDTDFLTIERGFILAIEKKEESRWICVDRK